MLSLTLRMALMTLLSSLSLAFVLSILHRSLTQVLQNASVLNPSKPTLIYMTNNTKSRKLHKSITDKPLGHQWQVFDNHGECPTSYGWPSIWQCWYIMFSQCTNPTVHNWKKKIHLQRTGGFNYIAHKPSNTILPLWPWKVGQGHPTFNLPEVLS